MLDYPKTIRERRTELGLTIEELAEKAGTAPFTIERIEHCSTKRNARFDTVEKIFEGLGLKLVVEEKESK